ncbi:hypothetical protein M3B90_09440 [Dermabacter sp. p3-SID358]|uniref:hypothetical protein n=1 Tax=Dermabacter sp. p3-SID358 TaxID=2916114 RepID=UPI0021A85461|nr:hypothetical protein [Dermabacter sp. p3-SID358]MCT1867748.1 hypothetical protein [Dermabacter sp. p3-SID358]
MNTAFIGMSPEQGVSTGENLISLAAAATSALHSARESVQSAQWVGEDRDSFVSNFEALATAIEALLTNLRAHGEQVKHEAAEQMQASAAS